MTEDEMVGWHHQFNGHEFKPIPEDSEGQGSLACCSSWGHKESDTTEQLNRTGSSDGKEPACNVGDPGSIPGLKRSPGERHGNPLQYSCLENPMEREAWWAIVHRVAKSQTRLKQLSTLRAVYYSPK